MTGAAPLVSEVARPWWDALARGEIAMQRCDGCAGWVFYPRAFCPGCGGRALKWTPVKPVATLYTFSIAHVPVAPAFAHLDRPILAVAEFANGVRVPTTLVETVRSAIRIGMPLAPVFDGETYPGITLLRFRAANAPEQTMGETDGRATDSS